jgi:beta-galactosidase
MSSHVASDKKLCRPVSKFESLEPRRLLTSGTYVPDGVPALPRDEVSISRDWKFNRGDVSGAASEGFDDSGWTDVDVPHTWNALDGQNGGNDYWRGTSWYRKSLEVPTKWSKKRVMIRFDGVSIVGNVFVNGELVTTHSGANSAFTYDITPQLRFGQANQVAVKVNNAQNNDIPPHRGDYTMFGGIYRDVSLIIANRAQINPLDKGSPGLWITQNAVSDESASVTVRVLMRNMNSGSISLAAKIEIFDADGDRVESVTTDTRTFKKRQWRSIYADVEIADPRRWDGVNDPYLYTVRVAALDGNGNELDAVYQPLGLRTMEIDAARGFLLNGRPYQLRGANLHEDRLDKGRAISDADREQDFRLLTDMGANSVRLVHWQHDPYAYELANRLGLIVWTEIPLWGGITESSAYTANALEQLKELIRQNYNHPSIAAWGLFNELDNTLAVRSLIATLHDQAKAEDPGRPTVAATKLDFPNALNEITDHVATNKYIGWYSKTIGEFGAWLSGQMSARGSNSFGMGEYGAGASINQHELYPTRPIPAESEWHPEEYQNLLHEGYYKEIAKFPQIWSVLVWQMTDSANDNRNEGDTPGRNDKGLVTYDREIKKDAYYFYRTQWTNKPMLYITSHRYTNREAAQTYVKVYSNLGAVTLSVNGQTIGTKSDSGRVIQWDNVTLRPGANTITVTATRKGTTYSNTAIWNYGASASVRTTDFANNQGIVTARFVSAAAPVRRIESFYDRTGQFAEDRIV